MEPCGASDLFGAPFHLGTLELHSLAARAADEVMVMRLDAAPPVDRFAARGAQHVQRAALLLVALTTAEAIQVVGVLLVLTLVITPAAAATRLTARPGLALVLSIAIALVATEGGILLSLVKSYPTSFFISAISFAAYVIARVAGAREGARARVRVQAI